MWIFGYGSLVWKVDFPYAQKLIGYIKGYDRRFWQASIDHRGTPEKPGRAVTLVPSSDPEARVWGAAYKIDDSRVNDVLLHLDHREVMGYEKVPILFHPISSHPMNELPGLAGQDQTEEEGRLPFEVTMYYGSSQNQNEHYLGEASVDVIAKQILESVGPSGANKDYLFNLANAMRQIKDQLPERSRQETLRGENDVIDSHLSQLETAVMQLDKRINVANVG